MDDSDGKAIMNQPIAFHLPHLFTYCPEGIDTGYLIIFVGVRFALIPAI